MPRRRGSAIQAWLSTLPGFLTAVGGLLTALVGAYIALRPASSPPDPPLRTCRRLASLLGQDAALVRLLGKPETASKPTRIRLQVFERGFLLWLVADDAFLQFRYSDHSWQRVVPPDVSPQDIEAFRASAADPRKKNFETWAGGFIRLWQLPSTKDLLGWPILPGVDAKNGCTQRFAGGRLVHDLPFWEVDPPTYKMSETDDSRILLITGSRTEGEWEFRQ